jgi:hypothetical protein
MDKGLSIVGSSRKNGYREENDFYPTPAYAVEELLKREKFDGNIWECACGDGAISDVLKSYNYETYSTDLINRGYGDGIQDFLTYDGKNYDNIITNPPFSEALNFVEQAKKFSNNKIALFLKTVFLEGSSRYDMFHDNEYRLKCMYQFSKRVSLTKNGIKMKNSGMISFAWFVWQKDWASEPLIRWIK